MKKIIINAPRRSGSTFLTMLVRNCLPVPGSMYLEKIDSGYSFAAKIELWKLSHENQIQVTTVRDPYDSIVSLLESDVSVRMSKDLSTLLTDDVGFIKKTNILIKSLEKYYKAIYNNSDEQHIAFNFDRLKDEDGPRAIIDKIFYYAGIPEINDDFWSLAYETAVVETTTTSSHIRHMPGGDETNYNLVKEKLETLKDSISFELLNTAYTQALTKCVNV
jgi:hypothetical protein